MNMKYPISGEQSHDNHQNSSQEILSGKSKQAYQSAKKMTIISKAIGYIGIVIGVLSLFFYPYIFGVIGIIFGFISMKLGEIALSSWAIGICALSIILALFVVPSII